jgi:lysophospholipase L1-like esterase
MGRTSDGDHLRLPARRPTLPGGACAILFIATFLALFAWASPRAVAYNAKQTVLVVGAREDTQNGLHVAAGLRSLGYKVTLTMMPPLTLARRNDISPWTLPKLSRYSAVWSVTENRGYDSEALARLEEYVAAGGRLYLGAAPATEGFATTDQELARALLMDTQITVNGSGDSATASFSSTALDGIAQQPNVLSQMPLHAAGEIYGVEPRNRFASDAGRIIGAAFDEADMASGRGRLVIYDDEWAAADPDPSARNALLENIQDFLEATPTRVSRRSAQYVALGDSYAAGVGSFEYLEGTTGKNGCYRAVNGYAEKIAAERHLSLSFDACNGAKTVNLWEAANGREPQLNDVGPDTELVTLTIGGNDLGFKGVLKKCVTKGSKLEPITEVGRGECRPELQPQVETALAELRNGREPGKYALPGGGSYTNKEYLPGLQQLYETILYQAPEAKVIVVGYPGPFESLTPGYGRPDCQVGTWEGVVKVWMIPANQNFLDDGAIELNSAAQDAVLAAYDGRDIVFANPTNAFAAHGLCDEEASFIQPLMFEGLTGKVKVESFHPTVDGQTALYNLIMAAIEN